MSADNWGICPRCKVRDPFSAEKTLREDYEFWMTEDGEFSAEYGCRCTTCGWSFQFRHAEQVPVGEAKR